MSELELQIKRALENGPVLIYGAHLVAVEVYRYICRLKINFVFAGFGVTSAEDNPAELMGERVMELSDCQAEKNMTVLLAMPEKYHPEAQAYAESLGFSSFIRVGLGDMSELKGRLFLRMQQPGLSFQLYEDAYDKNWLNVTEGPDRGLEAKHYKFPTLFHLDMEAVIQKTNGFHFDLEYERLFGAYQNLHALSTEGYSNCGELPLRVYMVFSQRDSAKLSAQDLPPWICPIQAGSALAEYKANTCLDESGDSVSDQNGALAEMTAAYWIWKNAEPVKYKGLCHYRRHFLLDQAKILALERNGVDVILPTPRYAPGGVRQMFLSETPVKEPVFQMLFQALAECHPEERFKAEAAIDACLYYPNNMVIAKREIYDAYCAWIFPVLFRMMELDKEFYYGHEEDRHIAYAAELLTSCYFAVHKDRYRIWVADYQFIT